MRKNYTYSYIKTVTGRITVSGTSDEEAEEKAREELEKFYTAEGQQSSEVGLLDLRDVEPANINDNDE